MQHPYQQDDDASASTLGSKSGSGDGDGDGYAQSISNNSQPLPRIFDAGLELDSLCRAEISGGENDSIGFPPTCLPIVRLLIGNHCCVDCGDERSDSLQFASIGYGTILCHECAHRHATTAGEESNIKHLYDEHWSLRSTLTMLEGSNTQMIDYVKHKPHWRPPKGKDKENLSEGELAFNQIYLSKAAGTFRKNIAKKVDDKFYSSITNMREEDAAKEEQRLHAMNISRRDPFQKIFEQNNVSTGEIPDFFNNTPSQSNDAKFATPKGGGVVGRNAAPGSSVASARGAGGRRGRNMSTPLMKHESPSADLIKDRINTRRSMNSSIVMSQHLAAMKESDRSGDEMASLLPNPVTNVIPTPYLPQSSRRTSDYGLGLVGEVGNASIQDHYDDNTSTGDGTYRSRRQSTQQNWSVHGNDDTTMISYSSRAANASTIGRYQRYSTSGA